MAKAKICTNCGSIKKPALKTPGSILIEIVLWLCLIVPGIVYSLWRHSARTWICADCRQDSLVPINTPKGQELLKNKNTPD